MLYFKEKKLFTLPPKKVLKKKQKQKFGVIESWIHVIAFALGIFVVSMVLFSAPAEIVERRTVNSKSYDLGDGQMQTDFHAGPIHYLDENGVYEDIDTEIVESDGEFAYEVTKGIYQAYFSDNFDSESPVKIFFEGHEIEVAPGPLGLLVNDGSGKVVLRETAESMAEVDGSAIFYDDAYGEGLDVQMRYTEGKFYRELIIESYDALGVDEVFDGEAEFVDIGFAFDVKLAEDSQIMVGNEIWDGKEETVSDSISFVDDGGKIFSFAPPLVIDADGRAQNILFLIKKDGDSFSIVKLIPLEFLKTAAYPVKADDVLDAYPSVDGHVYAANATYATANAATRGTTFDSSAAQISIGQLNFGTHYIYRGYIGFDTSAIDDDDTVNIATLQIYGASKNVSAGFDMNLVSWSDPPIIGSFDFDDVGTTSYGSISTTSFTAGQYNDIIITDTDTVSKAGSTYYAFRSSQDLAGTPAASFELISFYSVEASGTANDPVLSVTHGPPNAVPEATAISPSQDSGADTVTFTSTISDDDSHVTSLTVEYSIDNAIWEDATIASATQAGGEGDGITIADVGSLTDIDTDNDGSVDATIVWDAGVDISDRFDNSVYLRITPNDGSLDGTTVTSSAFELDLKAPDAPSNLSLGSAAATSATVNFGDVTPQSAPSFDINGSGSVNVADPTCTGLVNTWYDGQRLLGGIPGCVSGVSTVDEAIAAADYNCDGAVTFDEDRAYSLTISTGGSLAMGIDANANDIVDACEVYRLDPSFDEYKVYYKAGASGVTTSDTEIDSGSVAALGDIIYDSEEDFTISGLDPNTQYVANIWAFDDYGFSTSATEFAFRTLAAVPSAPTVTPVSVSSATVVINGGDNPASTEYSICTTDNGTTCNASGYVQADGSLDTTEIWQTKADWGGGSGQAVTGLAANTAYQFLTKARNADDTETALSSANTAVYTLANAVTGASLVNATDADAYGFTLTWSDNSQTGLKIEQDNGCDDTYDSTIYDNNSANSSSPLTVDSGITANTCYKYRFSSYNVGGTLNTVSVAETSEVTLPPAQVQSLAVTDADETSISISWDATTGATSYKVYNNVDDSELATISAPTTSATISSLTSNTSYTYYVRAISANGTGIASSTITQVTDALAPSGLTHDSQSTSMIRWIWDDDGQTTFLARDKNNTSDNSGETANAFWSQSGLSANTAYTVEVRGRNSDGTDTSFSEITRSTSQNAPTGLTFSDVSDTSVTITANGTFPNNGTGSSVIHFDNGDGVTQDVTDGASWTNTGLEPDTEYTYTVYATNQDGDQTASVTDSVTTDSNGVTSPGVADATTTSANQVNISWVDGGQAGLRIEQDIGCDDRYSATYVYDQSATNPTSPYAFETLPNTCYKFKLTSYGGSGSLSVASAVETAEITTPPGVSSIVSAQASSSSAIAVSWSEVESATGYYVYDSSDTLIGRSTNLSYRVTGLTGGTSYSYYVRAYNDNGTGAASATVSTSTTTGGTGVVVRSSSGGSSSSSSRTDSIESSDAESKSDSEGTSSSVVSTEDSTSSVEENVEVTEVEEVTIEKIDERKPQNFGVVKDLESSGGGEKIVVEVDEKTADEAVDLKVWYYDAEFDEFVYVRDQEFDTETKTIQVSSAKAGKYVLFDTNGERPESEPTLSENCERDTSERHGFADIKSDWINRYVQYLYGSCIVSGKENGVFDPFAEVTRAEFLKMTIEGFELGLAENYKQVFVDVFEENWFALYVMQGWRLGIVTDDFDFRPNDAITRREAIEMLFLGAEFDIEDGDFDLNYEDVDPDDEIYPYLQFAVEEGILDGSLNRFRPEDSITRAEAAKIVAAGIILNHRMGN